VPEDHSSKDWADLATTRAGQEVEAKARALRHAALLRTFVARLLGGPHRRAFLAAWRLGGEGEQAVTKQLERLGTAWRVLHSIVLSEKGTDLDQRVIGPATRPLGGLCESGPSPLRSPLLWNRHLAELPLSARPHLSWT